MGGDAIIVSHGKDFTGLYNSGGFSYIAGTVYGQGNTAFYDVFYYLARGLAKLYGRLYWSLRYKIICV